MPAKKSHKSFFRALFNRQLLLAVSLIVFAVVFYFVAYYFFILLVNGQSSPAPAVSDDRAAVVAPPVSANRIWHFLNFKPKDILLALPSVVDSNPIVTGLSDVVDDAEQAATPAPASSAAGPDQSAPAPKIIDPTLVFGSYFDTFASNYFIDADKTTLYHDSSAAAYLFPPDYLFEPVVGNLSSDDKAYLDGISINAFANINKDSRCLDKGCLTQTGNTLYFNGQKLSLPFDLSGRSLQAVSIGVLDNDWLVGFTLKGETNYEGLIYRFDGRSFSRLLTPEPIMSRYAGVFGFGGTADNFLAVYGAYQGIAYHFQADLVTDVSRFFDIRMMKGGFKPEILAVDFKRDRIWYVYSSSSYKLALIKLWQNGGSDIAGEVSFNSIFQKYDQSAVFKVQPTLDDSVELLVKVRRGSEDYWSYFRDYGFHGESGGLLVSSPLAHDGYASSITIKTIEEARLELDDTSADKVDLFFSADGLSWQKLKKEKRFDIQVPATKYFFLKAVVSASADKFYSPFISEISFNYYCRK